jgi:branched-chain amino acid aminotransferase
MLATTDITITRAEQSKLKDISLENVPFGKYFTDHMLEADYEGGEWKKRRNQTLPAPFAKPVAGSTALRPGHFRRHQGIQNDQGEAFIFRPYDNLARFNMSAERMQMPPVPEEIFVEGLKQLIQVDKAWIPARKDHSLYIRPLMFASDEAIGVRPSETYKFLILLSPTGPYYARPCAFMWKKSTCAQPPAALVLQRRRPIMAAPCTPRLRQKKKATTRYCGWMRWNINTFRKLAL